MSTHYDSLKWSRFQNIGADFRNLLKSKQAKQKVPDFGIPPSVKLNLNSCYCSVIVSLLLSVAIVP